MDLSFNLNAKPEQLNIAELSWAQARHSLTTLTPNLVQIIDNLSPSNDLTLIKARYPYGEKIISQGKLYLPTKLGNAIAIDSPVISNSLKEKLNYCAVPLSMPLNKACEAFIENPKQLIPLKIMQPGNFFGLYEIAALFSNISLDSVWSVSSGARSTFMLPKISNKISHNRLKKVCNFTFNPPRTLAEHGHVFYLINQSSLYLNEWHCDILFFTHAWFKRHLLDPAWAPFYNYLLRENTVQTHYNQNNKTDLAFNLAWQNFLYVIGNRNLRPRPYLVSTIKSLFEIAAGMQPAFFPANGKENLVPLASLQNAYIEIYKLKQYLPTIMVPHILMPGQEIRPVYYSLSCPTFPEGSRELAAGYDIISDERDIKFLISTLEKKRLNKIIEPTKHSSLLDDNSYDFFHNTEDQLNEILSAKKIPDKDNSFLSEKQQFPKQEFCHNAPFFSGCIRIYPKNTIK